MPDQIAQPNMDATDTELTGIGRPDARKTSTMLTVLNTGENGDPNTISNPVFNAAIVGTWYLDSIAGELWIKGGPGPTDWVTSDSEGGGPAGGDLAGNYPNPTVASVGGATAAVLGAHPTAADNPHSVTATQAGADPAGSALVVAQDLTAHENDVANPHAVTAAQTGADPTGSAAAVQANLDTHEGQINPHNVTAVQAGADPVGSAAGVQTNLDTHEADVANPHSVTAVQAGADPVGSASAVQGLLVAHEADNTNPHNVTLAQVGGINLTPFPAVATVDTFDGLPVFVAGLAGTTPAADTITELTTTNDIVRVLSVEGSFANSDGTRYPADAALEFQGANAHRAFFVASVSNNMELHIERSNFAVQSFSVSIRFTKV